MKAFLFGIIVLLFSLGTPICAMEKDEIEEEPKKGWVCKSINDLGPGKANHSNCQNCGTRIRYVHTMKNKTSKEECLVGCECAAIMEENKSSATRREKNYLGFSQGKFELTWEPWPDPYAWEPMGYKLQKKFKAKKTDTKPLVLAFKKEGEEEYRYNVDGPSKLFSTMKEAQDAAISHFLGEIDLE